MRKKIITLYVLVLLSSLISSLIYADEEYYWEICKSIITESGSIGSQSLVHNDNVYGLVWGNENLYFVKLDTEGNRIGADVRIPVDLEFFKRPSIVWNGDIYGIAWGRVFNLNGSAHDNNVYFVRIDVNGNIIGNHVNINEEDRFVNPLLTWNERDSEYGLFWNEQWRHEIYFARIDTDGNKIGDNRLLEHYGYVRSIVWTGSEYGVSTSVNEVGIGRYSNLYFFRLDEYGNETGETIPLTDDYYVSYTPSLTWNARDNEYGIAFDTGGIIYFTRIDADGNKIGNDIMVSEENAISSRPSIVWTGTEYGVAWMCRGDYSGQKKLMFTTLNSDGTKIENDIEITKSNQRFNFAHIHLVWNRIDNQYGIAWQESETGHEDYSRVYFATIKKVSSLIGRAPSIYKDKMTYHKRGLRGDYDIYLCDLGDRIANRITFNSDDQKNPDIYENIIVWQDNRNSYVENEDYGFNWFGFLNSCYASGLPSDDCWDIYMYNISTDQERLVASGPRQQWNPQVYGDYITWREGRYEEHSIGGELGVVQYPLDDIGIYKISTGETTYLSDYVDVTGLGSDYKIIGNLIVYRKSNDFYKYNILTETEELIPAEIGESIGSYEPWRRIHTFNGEWLVYNEIFADGSIWGRELPRNDFRQYLKAYNLITGELITIKEEWYPCRTFGGRMVNATSGDKFLYLDDLESDVDRSEQGLWLYDLSDQSSVLVDGECRWYTNSSEFGIWGNRVAYAVGNEIRPYSWTPNTNEGEGERVELRNGISIEFSNVISSGETIVERSLDGFGGEIENGARAVMFYNISTSAEYEGDIYITLNYAALDITDQEARDLVFYHWEGEPAGWIALERTEIDESEDTVTFVTTSLSPFALSFPNHAPKIYPISPKTITAGRILKFRVNATDPDGDRLYFSVDNLPREAKFVKNTFYWRPNRKHAGKYRVKFRASDGLLSDSKTVTIKVLPPKKIYIKKPSYLKK